ncbi:Mitochondrial import receptor subunit TOM20 -like protein [Sarcoptes scabiei]|nr:Mitochondrial import receptor subunit TOM20 -like protein [Sarcoptes scabiei]
MTLMTNSLSICAVAFLAYCVYFDRKRRSDPNFKAKLKQTAKRSKDNDDDLDVPIFTSNEEKQAYFVNQIKKAEMMLQSGEYEKAVIHFAKAGVVSGSKKEFFDMIQKNLPSPLFSMTAQCYAVINQRYLKKMMESSIFAAVESRPSNVNALQFKDSGLE